MITDKTLGKEEMKGWSMQAYLEEKLRKFFTDDSIKVLEYKSVHGSECGGDGFALILRGDKQTLLEWYDWDAVFLAKEIQTPKSTWERLVKRFSHD